MLLNILSLCFLFTGIQGADLDYVFDDQAEGWLKLYKTPAKWLDAKIRCETEEAVIASPLDARLRDALIDHVGRQNQGQKRTVTAVYTGVQADYSKGDFFSIEGIPIAQLAVGELHTSSVNYGSSESCIVWDLNGYAKLRRVKCEYSFPYVCYKRRTQLELPHSQPTGLKPNYAFDNRDPVSNYNTNTGPNIDDSVEETKLTIDEAWPSNPQRNNNDGQGLPQTGMTLEPPTSGGNVPTYSLTPTGGNVSTDSVPPSRRPTRTGYSRFISKAGGRFKLHLQPEIFETASTRCISEGAVIASPLTVDLKNEINNFLTQNSLTSPIFAGVRANLSNGDYYSTEGVSLTSMPVSLNPGTDSDYQSSDSCITMTGNDNIVTSVRCTDTYPYVCLKTSKPVRSCGNSDSAYEYEPKTQGCYKFHNDEKSWTEAYHICKGEGASLAVLNSKDEAEVLKSLFRRYPKNQIKGQYKHSAYMGLRDWKDGKSWTPVQGVKKSFYKGWAPNEPRAAAECSSIGRSGFLYSDSCQTKLSFICEKESEVLYDENE